MIHNEQKGMNRSSGVTNDTPPKNTKFTENLIAIFNMHKGKIVTIGNIVLFLISIFASSFSGSNISFLLRVRTIVIIALVIFACLSPVLIMSTVKGLRRFIIDKDIEDKNIELSENLRELANSLETSTGKLDKSIDQSKYYFEKAITHMDGCPGIDNLVRKSHMINNVDEYYQHMTKARKNADKEDVYLTSFSTNPYVKDNKYRDEYYSTDIEFITNAQCNVYRIVTVHSQDKLLFLKNLFEDAEKSKSIKYHLAYLDIEKFSNETDDILPGIVGMDIIGNEVIIMDFSYARALRKNDRFEKPLYIESEEIASMCRKYYEMVWNDISDENPESKCRYHGYILYNGASAKIKEDIDYIWENIENKISMKNKS